MEAWESGWGLTNAERESLRVCVLAGFLGMSTCVGVRNRLSVCGAYVSPPPRLPSLGAAQSTEAIPLQLLPENRRGK